MGNYNSFDEMQSGGGDDVWNSFTVKDIGILATVSSFVIKLKIAIYVIN